MSGQAKMPSAPPKTRGWLRTFTTTVSTALFASLAAGCFLSVALAIRGIQKQNSEIALQSIDKILMPLLSSYHPDWVNRIHHIYQNHRKAAVYASQDCFIRIQNFSSAFHRETELSAENQNPLEQSLTRTCGLVKKQVWPLLIGILDVMLHRLCAFFSALPLIALSLSLGLIDGLVQRDIRKFQGARETTFLFHRLKHCGNAVFFLPFFLYFVWLSPVSSSWFFIPMAVMLGVWLSWSVRFFKKTL